MIGILSGTISNLFPKLASARSAGHARVIQQGMLITENDVKATLDKTLTKKFELGAEDQKKGESTSAGFKLSVKPTIMQKEKVKLDIQVGVSSMPDGGQTKMDNKLATKVIVKNKDSAALGGVSVNTSATTFDRNEPGGADKIEGGQELFSFKRSKNYTSTRSQFVVFVTPEVIESASAGTDAIKRKFRQRKR